GFKVAVLGAGGGIGQPMSLLLKLNPRIKQLALFDVARTAGVGADISHCCTHAQVSAYTGMEEVNGALEGADVVVIPAGVPRKPGMTRDDLFNINAGIVKSLADACAKACPKAMFLIISNPVNSTVPIFAQSLKAQGVYNKQRLFGVTTLDVVRANTFVADNQKFDVSKTNVPVIGGHAGTTILPLLSNVAGANFSEEDIAALTHRIQFGGDEVVKAKDGAGSATLSMAFAGNMFAGRLLDAMSGSKNVVECAFVDNPNVDPSLSFFSSPLRLGPNGVEEILPMPSMSAFEKEVFEKAIPDLAAQAKKGFEFA
ncbi:unnamed protein product, partial [Ectocarpus fasciculatus]